MNASIEVPRFVVERARERTARTGRSPQLRDGRRRSNSELVAIPVNGGRLFAVGPEPPRGSI